MESGLSLFTWIPYNNRKRLRLLTLGIGHHTIDYMYRDTLYIINIDVFSEGDVSGQGEKTLFVNRIELSIENSENNRNFGDNHNIVIKFIENSKTMMEAILEKFKTPSSVTRLIYDKGYWQRLNTSPKRDISTIFLPKDVKENLIEYVNEFLSDDIREDFEKFGKPYKSNILLYGSPGTGKTSLINAVAASINSNIGIITFNSDMDDLSLMEALRSFNEEYEAGDKHYRILVMEDIDCLFSERKAKDEFKNSITLSGLLNCLDGMCRIDGLIIFLTANNISYLDKAILRPGRMDYSIEFKKATEYQVKSMYEKFYPSQIENFSKFYNKIKIHEFTTALLHQFFFDFRKKENIAKHTDDFVQLLKDYKNKCVDDCSEKNIYS